MESRQSPLQKAGVMLIRFYQKFISPLLGHNCRFYPTCSEYTLQAIKIHGFFRGCLLEAMRISRCQPLNPGGYDPVPPSSVRPKDNKE